MCGGSTTKDSTPPSNTGVRRNSPNRDSSSKKPSNTLLPIHAVHEHVRVFGFQRPRAPLVDLPVDPFELVAQCLRGHAVSPQQLADVVDLAGAHARQVHVDQGFLDALLAPPVAFDHRGLEQGALEFRHLQLEPAGLGGELAFVVAGPVRLPSPAALVSGGPGDLVGLGVEHRVEDLRHLLGDQPVEPGPRQVLVDLHDVRGSWFRLLASNRGFLFWRMKIVHRTRAMPSYVRAGIRKCARIRALSCSARCRASMSSS